MAVPDFLLILSIVQRRESMRKTFSAGMLLCIFALMLCPTTWSAQPETIKTAKDFLHLDAQETISKIALLNSGIYPLMTDDPLGFVTITNPEQIKRFMDTLKQLTLTKNEKVEHTTRLVDWYVEFFGQDGKIKDHWFVNVNENGIDHYSVVMSRLPTFDYKIHNYEKFSTMAEKLLQLNPVAK
jgi:hypothetical protein